MEEIKKLIGHLPNDLRQKFADNGIPEAVGNKIITNPEHAWYIMGADVVEKELAMWVTEEINAQLSAHKITYTQYQKNVPITHLADLLGFVKAGKISYSVAKEVFSEMVRGGKRAVDIIKEKNLEQVSDSSEIEAIVRKVIEANPDETKRLVAGDTKLLGFFIGQIMKESHGKANPQLAGKVLQEIIGGL